MLLAIAGLHDIVEISSCPVLNFESITDRRRSSPAAWLGRETHHRGSGTEQRLRAEGDRCCGVPPARPLRQKGFASSNEARKPVERGGGRHNIS